MSDILTQILNAKRSRLAAATEGKSLATLRAEALALRAKTRPHLLRAALSRKDSVNIIAEFKRRSPSKGVIRDDASPETIARAYEAGGAAAVSVLTEEDYFSGSIEDLRGVKKTTGLPVLRKDFIFNEYQIYESAAAGADAVLLIVAALSDELLVKLRQLTEDQLVMDALVEVHTQEEMQRAIRSGARLIGINNRDLKTFDVSIETSVKLAQMASADTILVSESGLNTRADLKRLVAVGFNAFLIGESLMRAADPGAAVRGLLSDK